MPQPSKLNSASHAKNKTGLQQSMTTTGNFRNSAHPSDHPMGVY